MICSRNPYDVFKAEFNRKNSRDYTGDGGHTGLAKTELFKGEKWNTFVKIYIRRWLGINEAYIRDGQIDSEIPIKIVYFEDLKEDASREMEKILYYLEQNIGFKPDDMYKRLDCIKRSSAEFEKYKREKQEFDFEIWDDEKIALVDAAIHQLSNAINEAGLPPMPDYYKGEKFIEGVDVSRRNIRVGSLYNKYRNM